MSERRPRLHLVEHRVTVSGEHEIIGIRELTDREVTEISAADELTGRVARSVWFRRLQDLMKLAEDRIAAVEAHDRPHPDEVGACRDAVTAVLEVQARLIGELQQLLDTHGGESTPTAQAAVDAVTASDAWNRLGDVSAPGAQLAFDRQPRLGILDAQGAFTALGPLLAAAHGASQNAFVETLLAVADAVFAAAQLLRGLHVECPGGVPALLDVAPIVEAEATGGDGSIIPHDLDLDGIYEALRLVHTAEKISEQHADTPLASFTVEGSDDAAPQPPPGGSEHAEPPDEQDGEQEMPAPAVVDLPGLIREAASLNDALEEAWSLALNRALASEGISRQMAALRAAVVGLQRSMQDDRVRVEEFPPGPDLIEQYERDPGRARERLASVQLVAFMEVLDGLKAFSAPTKVQVRLRQGGAEELTRFWESGAFGRLRGSLQLLEQLQRDPPPPDAAYPMEVDRRLRLAQQAWRSGDPEGCLFHAACALASHRGGPCGELDGFGEDHPARSVALAGLRALDAGLSGTPALAMAALTAAALADFAVDTVLPDLGERPLGTDELFDLIARDVPHVPLEER